jgi:hypothetical protein
MWCYAFLPCRLLASTYLAEDYFDLVDVDSFGSDSSHLAAALQAVKYGGMIYLTSTDGFCSGGAARLQQAQVVLEVLCLPVLLQLALLLCRPMSLSLAPQTGEVTAVIASAGTM